MKVSVRLIIIKWLKRFPPGKVKMLSFRKLFCQNGARSPFQWCLSTLICYSVENTKLSMDFFRGEHGTEAHTRTHCHWEGQWSQIPKMLHRNTSSGSSAFWCRKRSLPQTQDTRHIPGKRKAGAASSSFFPPRSLHCDISPLMMKVCLYLWGNFAGYI